MFGFLKKKEVVKKNHKIFGGRASKYTYQEIYDFAKNTILYQNFPTKWVVGNIRSKLKESTAMTYFAAGRKYIKTGAVSSQSDSFCRIIDEILESENIQPLPVPNNLQKGYKNYKKFKKEPIITNNMYYGVMTGRDIRKCNSETEAKLYLGYMKCISNDACIAKILIEPIE